MGVSFCRYLLIVFSFSDHGLLLCILLHSLLKLQTLSQSVGNAMKMEGRHGTHSTIKFIKTFNKTFDCLDVMTTSNRGNMNKLAYKSQEDLRFKVIYLYWSLLSFRMTFIISPYVGFPFSLKFSTPFVFSPTKNCKILFTNKQKTV